MAHVTLTYPWPRKYGLDFLDVIRTPGPCGGMPKGWIRFLFLFYFTETGLPGSEVVKLFSCSNQLSMKFFLLINVKMPTIVGI